MSLRENVEIRAEKMKPKFQFFLDEKCKVAVDSLGIDEIVDVGDTAERVYYLKNISGHTVDKINVEIEDPDARVELEKNSLRDGEVSKAVLRWTPDSDRLTGLAGKVRIMGRVLYT